MALTKLVVEEFETEEGTVTFYNAGYKYSYFKDPNTGKYYMPKESFVVTGENLEELFEEILLD